MAQTPAQKAALVKKALASENKSDGMRMLLDAGFTVPEVKEAFNAAYGFVYGVAVRNGNVTPTTREAKPKAAKAAPAKATKTAPAKVATARKTATAAPKPAPRAAKTAGKQILGKSGKPLTGAALKAAQARKA